MLCCEQVSAAKVVRFIAVCSTVSATALAPGNNVNASRAIFGIKGKNMASRTTAGHNNFAGSVDVKKTDPLLPTMIVFDLDDCLWTPEMHELHGEPSIPVEGYLNPDPTASERLTGVVGMQVPRRRQMVRLFDGAREALFKLATDPKYAGITLAAASTSLEPSYSHACLEGIEILPGLTLRDMFKYDQIGRSGQLTSRKTSHFRLLQQESGVPFEEMLFFDDCNWGDHCADVTNAFGVVSQRTPSGMRLSEFYKGLEKYKAGAESRGCSADYRN